MRFCINFLTIVAFLSINAFADDLLKLKCHDPTDVNSPVIFVSLSDHMGDQLTVWISQTRKYKDLYTGIVSDRWESMLSIKDVKSDAIRRLSEMQGNTLGSISWSFNGPRLNLFANAKTSDQDVNVLIQSIEDRWQLQINGSEPLKNISCKIITKEKE